MAYIKIFPIKVTDKKALDYIMNPDKTEEKLLISSFACSPESADLEFAFTREEGKKNVMDKGNNLAFHLIQSFKPGEVDAETAHKLGKEFSDEVLKGKYEYVISTHVDQDHIHNHIIFNATSFVDHHKYKPPFCERHRWGYETLSLLFAFQFYSPSDKISFIKPTHYRTRGGEWRGCIAATSHKYMSSVIR